MKNLQQSQEIITKISKFYASLDRNGCFMDDLKERLRVENIPYEVEAYTQLTQGWFDNGYLSHFEHELLMEELGKVKENFKED